MIDPENYPLTLLTTEELRLASSASNLIEIAAGTPQVQLMRLLLHDAREKLAALIESFEAGDDEARRRQATEMLEAWPCMPEVGQ